MHTHTAAHSHALITHTQNTHTRLYLWQVMFSKNADTLISVSVAGEVQHECRHIGWCIYGWGPARRQAQLMYLLNTLLGSNKNTMMYLWMLLFGMKASLASPCVP